MPRSASLLVSASPPPPFAYVTTNTDCAGQINRHKNEQPSDQQAQSTSASRASTLGSMASLAPFSMRPADAPEDPSHLPQGWRSRRGAYPSRGYRSRAQVHRNRTLVLNSNASTSPNSATADASRDDSQNATLNTTARPGWVTKTDRHLQLINASIFEKDSQSRVKAMEETRKQKLRQRDERERARFNKHLYGMRGSIENVAGVQPPSTNLTENYEISVQGIRFRVAKNGSKLVKVPGESLRPPKAFTEA